MNVIKIDKKGDDGYRVISIRIRKNTLDKIDKIAYDSNHSRNEIMNILLENAVEIVEITE